MSTDDVCLVTFPVSGGIFGVGRLATRLNALAARGAVGEWHVGQWLDWTHKAIRIRFDTEAHAALAKRECHEAATDLPVRYPARQLPA